MAANKNVFNDYLIRITGIIKVREKEILKKNDINLTSREFDYLGVFAKDEKTKLSSMANELGIAKSTLSNTIKKMIKKGYITIKRDEDDDRVKIITLTDKGWKAIEIRDEIRKDYYEKISNSMNTDEKSKFFQILDKIIKSIEK